MLLFSKVFAHKEQPKIVPPVSGGGLSEDGRFSFGYSSLCGKRASMEDCFETRVSRVNDQIVGLFGVFDGHGGARAAEYIKLNLLENLLNHPQFFTDTKEAIAEVYRKTDLDYLQIADNNPQSDCGSTASTAVVVGDRLIVANVGDSRVVLSRGGQAVPLSTDHKPNRLDERQRIEQAGGVVLWAGTWRVGGMLAVSRAFGDKILKKYISADPDIQEEEINEDVEFLLLASDGLWDVITNKDLSLGPSNCGVSRLTNLTTTLHLWICCKKYLHSKLFDSAEHTRRIILLCGTLLHQISYIKLERYTNQLSIALRCAKDNCLYESQNGAIFDAQEH